MPGNPVLFVIIWIALFAGIWLFVLLILSRASGWALLADRFPAGPASQPGPSLRATMYLGPSRYRNSVRWRIADDRLVLALPFPLRIFHPPIGIPLSEIELQDPLPAGFEHRRGTIHAALAGRAASIPADMAHAIAEAAPAAVRA